VVAAVIAVTQRDLNTLRGEKSFFLERKGAPGRGWRGLCPDTEGRKLGNGSYEV
jgi:hypothetical protein